MKITKIGKNDEEMSFMAEECGVAYLNTLRRAIMDFVPTLAIEDVAVKLNSSVLYDEIIAHRLGLVPITTEPGSYSFRVDGESGLGSELHMTLSAKGPGIVVAEEIKSKDSKAKPAQAKMPITKLLKGQELDLEMTAVLGRGIEHAKWSPGMLYYQYVPEIAVDNNAKELAENIEKFPKDVVEKGKINKEKIIKLGLAEACEGICPEAVAVTYNPEKIEITVESWGQLPPAAMVEEGCKYIDEALDELAEAVKELK